MEFQTPKCMINAGPFQTFYLCRPMVRRIPSQVHKQAARLLRSKYIQREPVWYQAVLAYPPIPLPSRAPPSRSTYDLPPEKHGQRAAKNRRYGTPKPLPVHYLEDDVRRQFFRDHPFEAFRPVTLVEAGSVANEHSISGKEWTRLRQRGRNPCPEEYVYHFRCLFTSFLDIFSSAVKFTVNLHKYHEIPLNRAYAQAIAQYRALRAEHHVATVTAALEAEAYGAKFPMTNIEQNFWKEQRELEGWEKKEELDAGAIAARKRWKAIVDRKGGVGSEWSKGQDYVRLWKEGLRPTYMPSLTEPTPTESTADEVADSVDWMQIEPSQW